MRRAAEREQVTCRSGEPGGAWGPFQLFPEMKSRHMFCAKNAFLSLKRPLLGATGFIYQGPHQSNLHCASFSSQKCGGVFSLHMCLQCLSEYKFLCAYRSLFAHAYACMHAEIRVDLGCLPLLLSLNFGDNLLPNLELTDLTRPFGHKLQGSISLSS